MQQDAGFITASTSALRAKTNSARRIH